MKANKQLIVIIYVINESILKEVTLIVFGQYRSLKHNKI